MEILSQQDERGKMRISAVLVLLLVQWKVEASTQPLIEVTTNENIQKSNETRPKRQIHMEDYFQNFAAFDEHGSLSCDYDYEDLIRQLSSEQHQPNSMILKSLCKDFVGGGAKTRHDPRNHNNYETRSSRTRGRHVAGRNGVQHGITPLKNVQILIQNNVGVHKPQEVSAVGAANPSNSGQFVNNSVLSTARHGPTTKSGGLRLASQTERPTGRDDEIVGAYHGQPDVGDQFNAYKGRSKPVGTGNGNFASNRPRNHRRFNEGNDNFGHNRPLSDEDDNFDHRPFSGRDENFGQYRPFTNRGPNRPFSDRDEDFGNNKPLSERDDNFGHKRPFGTGGSNFDHGHNIHVMGNGKFEPHSLRINGNPSWGNNNQFLGHEDPNHSEHNANCNPSSAVGKQHLHNIVIQNTLLMKPGPPNSKQTAVLGESQAKDENQQSINDTSSENMRTRSQDDAESSEQPPTTPSSPMIDARAQFLQQYKPQENQNEPMVGNKRQYKSARFADRGRINARKHAKTRSAWPRRLQERPRAVGRRNQWDYAEYDDDFRSNSPTNRAEHFYQQTRGKPHSKFSDDDSIEDFHDLNEEDHFSELAPELKGPPIYLSKTNSNERFEDLRRRDNMIQGSTVAIAERTVAPVRAQVNETSFPVDLVRRKANATSKTTSRVPDPPRFLFSMDRVMKRPTNATLSSTSLKGTNTTSKGHILVLKRMDMKQKKNQGGKKNFDQVGQASYAIGTYKRYLDDDQVPYRSHYGSRKLRAEPIAFEGHTTKSPLYKTEYKTEVRTVVHPLPNNVRLDEEERRRIVNTLANKLIHSKPRYIRLNARELNAPSGTRKLPNSFLSVIRNAAARERARDIYLDDTSILSRPKKPTTIVIKAIPDDAHLPVKTVYIPRHNFKELRPFQHNIDCDEDEAWLSSEHDEADLPNMRPRCAELYGHRRHLSKFGQKHHCSEGGCLT